MCIRDSRGALGCGGGGALGCSVRWVPVGSSRLRPGRLPARVLGLGRRCASRVDAGGGRRSGAGAGRDRRAHRRHRPGGLSGVQPGELDVVLWPENSTDIDPRADAGAADAITAAAQEVGAPILVGADHFPETGGRLNTSLLWDPQLGPIDSYAKRHPAPFAEYIPMRDIARAFSDAVDRVQTDMVPGTEVGVIHLPVDRLERTVALGVGICFEVAYDDLMRNAVQAGAEMIVIPTNNATFGPTDLSTQQLAMSRIRAIEHGRATVQISTVGVSGVISPSVLD